MKKLKNRFIRICTPVLCLLLLLPSFCLWAVAETQSTENGMSSQALESAEALDLQRAELVSDLDGESLIFNYVDRASFIEAGHVERVYEDEEPNTYVFKNADGSKTVYFLDEDVKYVNAGGEATEKKLDLVALDGGYTTRASNVSLALPNAIASGVTLAYNGNSVTLTPKPRTLTGGTVTMSAGSSLTSTASASMTAELEAALMEQALQIAPVGIASGKADYQNVFGTGTTLRYTPTLSGVKEDVILDAYRGQNTFAFTLNTGNLSVFEEEGRYFIALTADAEEKILISDTWVYDAAGNFEKGTLSVVQVKNGLYLLTVGASVEFLTDENTVYPVYIDPSLTVNSGTNYIEDAGIYSGKPTTNYGSANYFDVGTYSSTLGVGRAVVRLNGLISSNTYQNLHGELIDKVEFHFFHRTATANTMLNVHPLVNESWSASTVTWDNVGQYGAAISNCEVSTANTAHLVDITDLIYDWKTESAQHYHWGEQGFILISSNETARNRFHSTEISNTSYKPYVTLTYREGIEILHPEYQYREVAANESVYVGLGKTVQFKIAGYPISDSFSWTVDDTAVATVNSATGELTALSCGTVTLTTTHQLHSGITVTDSIEIEVVPIAPGEYYFLNKEYKRGLYCYSNDLFSGIEVELEENEYVGDNDFSSLYRYKHLASTWTFDYYSAGYYTIKYKDHAAGSLYMSYDASTNAILLSSTINNNSFWVIDVTSDGDYRLIPYSLRNTGKCVSIDRSVIDGRVHLNYSFDAYTLDENENDEWEILPATLTFVNYYDSSIMGDATTINAINKASRIAAGVFERLYGVRVNVENAIYPEGLVSDQCTTGMNMPCTVTSDGVCGAECIEHHKNLARIADQISELCEDTQALIVWSNRAPGTFCFKHNYNPDGGGLTIANLPVIQIMLNQTDFGTDNDARLAYMVNVLLHELAHYYGLLEQYKNCSHAKGEQINCVMMNLGWMYYDGTSGTAAKDDGEILHNLKRMYSAVLTNEYEPYCDECMDQIYDQLYLRKYTRRNYE